MSDRRHSATPPAGRLTVVVTTRNEAANIGSCLDAFAGRPVELIVVDNGSTDDTKRLAAERGALVFDKGPERCAQRNLGWQKASSPWVIVLDADMILPAETLDEILRVTDETGGATCPFDACWIPEVRTGTGFRVKCRNFERSFYDGTVVDALRLFRRSILEQTGGYDERLIAGGEDWELDIRILAAGARCSVLKGHLLHNEKFLTFRRLMEKKAYYSKSIADYRAKWPDHPAVRKQFSVCYRYFGVFVENGKWKRLLRHPILALGMYFERFCVGLTYLLNR